MSLGIRHEEHRSNRAWHLGAGPSRNRGCSGPHGEAAPGSLSHLPTHWTELHGNAFAGQKVLVTGGAGFIGSHLCDALVQLGAEVRTFDDCSGGSKANLADIRGPGPLTFLTGTLLDEAAVQRAVEGCALVFHQAALPSVPRSITMPRRYHDVNVTGTQILLDAAVAGGVKRVMFAASSSAYGDTPTLPKEESMPPRPKSPYAANKVAGECLLHAYANCFDMDCVALRYFNIFGPRQNANSAYAGVIAAFARQLLQGQRPRVFGDGTQTRDFTFVDNAVHANLLAARRHQPLRGRVLNVACGRAVSVDDLAQRMAAVLQRTELTPEHGDPRPGDVQHSLASLDQISEALGYHPIVDFEAGLRQTVAWYQDTLAV